MEYKFHSVLITEVKLFSRAFLIIDSLFDFSYHFTSKQRIRMTQKLNKNESKLQNHKQHLCPGHT